MFLDQGDHVVALGLSLRGGFGEGVFGSLG